jgi:nitroreductase
MSVTPEELQALMRSRRSVRRYEDRPVPRETLDRLFEAAVTAPSASNKQPWRFFVVSDRARIAKMAAAVREATAHAAIHVPESSRASFEAYGDYFTRFEAAPTIVVPLYRPLAVLSNLVLPAIGDGPKRIIQAMEDQSGIIGTSLALQNFLLMAHAEGIGASGMTGPLIAEPALRAILEIPNGWRIVALVPVGFPAEQPTPTDRKPVDKVVRWL